MLVEKKKRWMPRDRLTVEQPIMPDVSSVSKAQNDARTDDFERLVTT